MNENRSIIEQFKDVCIQWRYRSASDTYERLAISTKILAGIHSKSRFRFYSYELLKQKMAWWIRKTENDLSQYFLYRKSASKIWAQLTGRIQSAQNKLQKLPKMKEIDSSSSLKEISKIESSKSNLKREFFEIDEAPWRDRLPSISDDISCSSIKVSIEESSSWVSKQIEQTPCHNSSNLLTSKFLDFSTIHVRKTRKQILNEISFESEVHNIYDPKYDSSVDTSRDESEFKPKNVVK